MEPVHETIPGFLKNRGWDNFFDQSQYTGIAKDDTLEEKYIKSINRFIQGMESDDNPTKRVTGAFAWILRNKKLHLLFGGSGDYELNLFA